MPAYYISLFAQVISIELEKISEYFTHMSVEPYEYHPATTAYHKLPSEPLDTPRSLIFIPGNPGLVEFYIVYLNLIQEQYPDLEILCVSHAGQNTTPSTAQSAPQYDVHYQVQHKYEIIRKHILDKYDDKPVELWIMCHSMGGFVTQRAVRELTNDSKLQGKFNLKFVGLICPTIKDLNRSNSGTKAAPLFEWLPMITMVVWFSKLLNLILTDESKLNIIQNKVLQPSQSHSKAAKDLMKYSVGAVKDLISSPAIVRQALHLVDDELRVIRDDDTVNDWFYKDLKGTKIWTFYAHNDHWVANSTRDSTIARYHNPQDDVVFELGSKEENIQHAFCVNQLEEFAAITLKQLKHFQL